MTSLAIPPITIVRGLPEVWRHPVAALYYEAFAAKLGVALGPPQRAAAFLAEAFDPNFALVAAAADRPLGVAGYRTQAGTFVSGDFALLAKHYGRFGAVWRVPPLALLERSATPGVLTMDGIAVAREARGHGVGSRLLDAIKVEAARRGCAKVRLDVIDTNPRAQALYERHGFVPGSRTHIGPLRRIFGFSSALTMTHAIGPPAAHHLSQPGLPRPAFGNRARGR